MVATINQRPGVYIDETLLATNTTAASSDSLEAFVGVLPQGPLTPVKISNWPAFKRVYGGFVTGAPNVVAHAVYQFFRNGGSTCIIVRAVDTATAVAASREFHDTAMNPVNSVVLTASSPGLWGNTLYAEWVAGSGTGLVTLRLRVVPAGSSVNANQIVETWPDLSLDPASTRNVLRLLNDPLSGSNYVDVSLDQAYTFATGDAIAVSAQAGGDPLVGGIDGNAPSLGANGDFFTAVQSLDSVNQPFVLNLPTITDSATIDACIAYADSALGGRGDVFLVIDPDPGLSTAAVIEAAAAYTDTSYAAIYYPRVIVSDPSTTVPGATITLAPGGMVLGQYAATDAQRGVFKTPAGLGNAINGALGTEANLTNSDLDSLNAAGVNAIRPQPGAGICIMGGRTLHQSPSDKYISIRRTLIYVESQLRLITQFAIFEPNDLLLWNHLQSVCSNALLALWQSGGLTGSSQDQAFFVICDDSTNTPESVAAGQVNISVGVALEYPSEFVIINIGQFDGGTTVTEQQAA